MPAKNNRTRLYTLLAVGKKQLGWDDDIYRLFLSQHGAKEKAGKVSASTMSFSQLYAAVEAMKAKGFKPTSKSAVNRATDWRKPMIAKITAIWCRLADAGVVLNRSEAAMTKWCARITRKAKLEWATADNLRGCIEGLKKWAQREKVALDD